MCQFLRLQSKHIILVRRWANCWQIYSRKAPRFFYLKIINILVILLSLTISCQASEFDFVFDVSESPAAKKTQINLSEYYQSEPSWRAELQVPLLPGLLKGSGELAYGSNNKNEKVGYFESDKYLIKLGSRGKQKAMGYGLNFYSVGKSFNGTLKSEDKWKKGKTGYESWVSWKSKEFQVKSKFSQFWKNKLKYDQWLKLETEYSLFSKPEASFSLSYGLGKKWNAHSSSNSNTDIDSVNLFKAQFSFADDYLKFSTDLSRLSSKNNLDKGDDVHKDVFSIKSTLLPEYLLSVTSSYHYSENIKTSKEIKTKLNEMKSSLGVIYKWVEIPGQLKLTSAYNNYQSSDGLTNKDEIKFGAEFNWKLHDPDPDVKANWSVDFQYKDTKNYINRSSSTSNWSVNLLWSWSLT